MSSFIPTTRAVIGEDLDTVREQAGARTADAVWMFGISISKWTNVVRNGNKEVVTDATLALLVRHLSEDLGIAPLPAQIDAHEVFDLVKNIRPETDKKHFGVMFGTEASSGYRWLTKNNNLSIIMLRLFSAFSYLLKEQKDQASAEKFLSDWERMVQHEAEQRGVPQVFSTGCWNKPENENHVGKPVIGEDLNILREQLGLSVMDVCHLLGISMTAWMNIVNKMAKEPIDKVSLALYVRVLMKYPQANPLPKVYSSLDIFEEIKKYVPDTDKRRLAIMFGCEASSGYRWITTGGKISPVLERLFYVFMHKLNKAASKSTNDAIEFIENWNKIVVYEGTARGKADIFKVGRWTTKEDVVRESEVME